MFLAATSFSTNTKKLGYIHLMGKSVCQTLNSDYFYELVLNFYSLHYRQKQRKALDLYDLC